MLSQANHKHKIFVMLYSLIPSHFIQIEKERFKSTLKANALDTMENWCNNEVNKDDEVERRFRSTLTNCLAFIIYIF